MKRQCLICACTFTSSVTDIAVFTAERTLFVTVNAELPIVHVQKSKQNSRIIFIMNSFKIAFIPI